MRPGAVAEARNLALFRKYGIVSTDLVRQATAEFGALVRFCPFNSMAPVLAIADMVADFVVRRRS
jgi:hypothetical protein